VACNLSEYFVPVHYFCTKSRAALFISVFHFVNCVFISVKVQISFQNQRVPVGVGMVSDPMVARRSGKKLPMEDISFCQYPLQGLDQVSN
jgi:hypothetical protein